jgi:HSP20 family protein
MRNYSLEYQDGTIYPGDYVPLFSEAEIVEELKNATNDEKILPPANIIELPDSFRVELAIPGAKKEDFSIHADKHVLSVSVVHKEKKIGEEGEFRLKEFTNTFFDRHIILPENAETEFISADYDAGILRLHFPKVNQPVVNLHTRIIVY